MIDKIEAMIEPQTSFRGDLENLKRAAPWNNYDTAVRPSKFYAAVADLRPLGLDAMLHIQQKRYGTHKVEMFETGKKGMTEIESILERIVDGDPRDCRLGRIDLAADVRDVSLSWFREHAYVQYKQFLCEHGKLVDAEYSEMGKKVYQTLYFGKRPSCVRIYDKVAERVAVYNLWIKRETRKAKREHLQAIARTDPVQRQPLSLEFPTMEQWLAVELPVLKSELASRAQPALLPEANPAEQKVLHFPIVTRVENQFGGRVPEQMKTVGEIRRNVVEFNPFARMRLMGSGVPPGLYDREADGTYRFTVMQWCTGMYIHQNWKALGAAQMRSMLNRDRNFTRLMSTLLEFLPAEAGGERGITEPELYERYRSSISRQLAA